MRASLGMNSAQKAAKADHRSVASLIEKLLVEHLRATGYLTQGNKAMSSEDIFEAAKRAVVTVGGGRGFCAGMKVITAAHCLPHLPPAHPASYPHERTYENLLGPLGAEPTIWAECIFVDPVADVAILDCPDRQELASDQIEAWDNLINEARGLTIGQIPRAAPAPVRMLNLNGGWISGHARWITSRGGIWLTGVGDGIRDGMSGSPILNEAGKAVGLVSVSFELDGDYEIHTKGGPNPNLAFALPRWTDSEKFGDVGD